MSRRSSLRYRIAVAFSLFGGGVSIVLAFGLYVAWRDLEEQLIDDTLTAELEDYSARLARNPASKPETTATIRAYVLDGAATAAAAPAAIRELSPGRHELTLDGRRYRAAVQRSGERRLAILFNESQALARERGFVLLLLGAVVIMSLASAAAGYWLAGRVIAPVTDLVRRVAGLRPEQAHAPLADLYPWDEVRELAQDFDDYLERLHAFILRERAFTGDVGHELRTPLAVIDGALEILLNGTELPERDRGRLLRIARAAREMEAITAALLALAREQEAVDNTGARCEVAPILEEWLERMQQLYHDRSVTVHLHIGARPTLRVDPALLSIVLGNLIRNAFAYTRSGSIRVALDAAGVSVVDTGVGMAPKQLERAFERHYRGGEGGAGIGLSLVKRICDRYGWRVAASSRSGAGTEVRLDFKAV